MHLLSSTLRQRPAWVEVATQLLHQPGGRWQETDLDNIDVTLMIPSGNSYQVLRLLLFSAIDVGKPTTMELIGGLVELCRSDMSNVSDAKILYALETGDSVSEGAGGHGDEGKERGLEGYMKLQIDLFSTQQPSLSSIPILPISHPLDLPSLLSSLQQQTPSPALAPMQAPGPIPNSAGAHPQHLPHNYNHPGDVSFNTYIPSRDTLLPLCTAPSTNQRRFTPLSPYSVSVLSGPIFINFPGLRDLLELVETEEGKEQIRNAMIRASGEAELGELGRVEAERFLAFWEHEFAV